MYEFNLIVNITAIKTHDAHDGDITTDDPDEVYFVVNGGGDSSLPPAAYIPRADGTGIKLDEGESASNIQLRNFKVNDGKSALVNTVVKAHGGPNPIEVITGTAELIVAATLAIAAVVAAPTVVGGITLGAAAGVTIAKGAKTLYSAFDKDNDQKFGAFGLGISIKDGVPSFLWAAGTDTPTKLTSQSDTDDSVTFQLTGSDGEYYIIARVEYANTVRSGLSYSLPNDGKTENLILIGDQKINGKGNKLDNIIAGNEFDNNIYGLGGNDIIYGRGGNDTLIGGEGSDSMFGGIGNDIYYIDDIGDKISEYKDEGVDLVYASISYALSENLENLTLIEDPSAVNGVGNNEKNEIFGNSLNNILYGQANDDFLSGGDGQDMLYGGSGNDLLVGDAGSDLIDGGEGVDTVNYEVIPVGLNSSYGVVVNIDRSDYQIPKYLYSSFSTGTIIGFVPISESQISEGSSLDVLGERDTLRELENIVGSNLDDVLIGNAADNIIKGLKGDDIFIGNSGNDILDGGDGIDTITYSHDLGRVFVNLEQNTAKDGFGGTDTLFNIENVFGSDFADIIIGNSQDNWLFGGDGNDTLQGGGGNDQLFGGGGNNAFQGGDGNDQLFGGGGADSLDGGEGIDTASYSTALFNIIANLSNSSANTGEAQGDTYISIENLIGSQFSDILTGDTQANYLWGLDGNDSLDGLQGADVMVGGLGNDTYNFDNIGDITIEGLNEGIDTVNAFINCSLASNLENLFLIEGSSATIGSGNDLDNLIFGNTSNNTLNGGLGNDTLYGGIGRDTLIGGQGNDRFVFNSIREAGDTILDFTIGSDQLVLTTMMQAMGYRGSNPIAEGFISARQVNSGLTSLMIDPDGFAGKTFGLVPFALLNNVSASNLLSTSSNFVFQ